MNKVILMGRLTRDPEIRYSNKGENPLTIGKFGLAVDRRFKRAGEPEADFFNCTTFGKQAEFVERYLKQGTKILVTGRVQNNNYTNRDGQKVYSVDVIIDEIEFAESKSASSGGGNGGGGYQPMSQPPSPEEAGDGFMNIPDGIAEELPFS